MRGLFYMLLAVYRSRVDFAKNLDCSCDILGTPRRSYFDKAKAKKDRFRRLFLCNFPIVFSSKY